jgi:type III pantothenate kinase
MAMLLAIDVGNTQTAIGVFEHEQLAHHWRISTDRDKTADEQAVVLSNLLGIEKLILGDISNAVLSSVVPSCTASLLEMAEKNLNMKLLIVGPGVKTGMPILYDNPHEVGADRIANAVAAFKRFNGATIVVDFGTAITFDAVSGKGEYLGGAISPGIEISAEALFSIAAKLSRVDLCRPAKVIGKNTESSVQSGLIYGFAGLVDSIVEKMKAEMKAAPNVIATGGFAPLIAPVCESIEDTDPFLTLAGLRIIHEMNVGQ